MASTAASCSGASGTAGTAPAGRSGDDEAWGMWFGPPSRRCKRGCYAGWARNIEAAALAAAAAPAQCAP